MNRVLLVLALSFAALPARAEGLEATLSDWGTAGLLQTPTARGMPDGSVTAGLTALGGLHRHVFAGAQLLPGLEVTLRDSAYPSWHGLSEPGVDAKMRLLREGPWWPALAVGGRDVTGSGLDLPGKGRFAGEYLVASRRWWNVDLSLGIGWGGLGDHGHVRNPLRFLGGRFKRDRDPAKASSRGPEAWFTGDRAALFGGVEWHTPLEGLSVKLEYSADRFRAQRQDDPSFRPGSPLNAGLAYRPWNWLELGASVEQGSRAMLRLAARFDPREDEDTAPRTPPPAVGARPAAPDAALPAPDIATLARLHRLPARTALVDGDRAALWLDPAGAGTAPLAQEVGRAARLLADGAPPEVEWLTVVTGNAGLDGSAVTLSRRAVEQAAGHRGSPEEIWRTARVDRSAGPPPDWPARLTLTVNPTLEASLFEQSAPLVQRTYGDTVLTAEPLRGLVLSGGLRVNVSHNLHLLDTNAIPAAEPVRSDLPRYADRLAAVERLYAAWLAAPSENWSTRLSVGHFEEMFGGVGAEALYRPLTARWALGLDLNRVWKRPPDDALRLAPESGRNTGHASLYWEAPGATTTGVLRLGRYLGGDWGGTLELMRAFDGGVRLSAQVTWTEGPDGAQSRYGGRLEQGIALTVPFSPGGSWPPDGRLTTAVRTLGRDAGQRLRQPLPLYDASVTAGYGRLTGSWPRLMD
ncbi:YjbH domain-containing protein [Azospirillum brasilense]|uniref:YjbH domain-containing protein n=1 Tax=Azospirillum brasilense TaxID=192 RepID=UPI000E69EAB6|nr:YjbH domain-containing protein [Azospirillum brasilense]NUB26052.1 YjbH domain-containing protein [Azospirillum brasilense]NUB34266.1 YjbH domain-containing protein [Azospirillum brasilense]RIW01328.1 YjbH domain-containing protein [Azospirillum brasilense]